MKSKVKDLFYNLHLWAGLLAGIFIFLICLSGTILTFEAEIKNFSDSSAMTPIDSALVKKSPEELFLSLKDQGTVTSFKYQGESLPYIVGIKADPSSRRAQSFVIDPTTGSILNDPSQGGRSAFFTFNFQLHRWLLGSPDSIGKTIVGVATIVMTFLLLTGLYLWWPKNLRLLKNVLKINFNNKKRMLYDLHNTLGFYSLIPVLVMCLTGLCWSFGWYRDGLSTVLGSKVFGERRIEAVEVLPQESRKDLNSLIAIVNEKLPYEGSVSFNLDSDPTEAMTVRKQPVRGLQYTDILQLNPYTGEIALERIFTERTFGSKITSMIRVLHTGEFYGLLSKIIYFITCLIATTMPITGTWMWLNKLKKKKRKLA